LAEGTLYDGLTAQPHHVRAVAEAGRLELSQDSGWSDSVDPALLQRIDAPRGMLRLGRSDVPGWRLTVPAEAEAELGALLGKRERYGRWIDRVGLVPALVIGGAITASVVAIGFLAPHWLAPHVPMAWERKAGSAVVGDFGSMRCRDDKGQRALETLVERVAPGATKGPDAIKIAALDIGIFNAAALPGGYVVVLKPAITETDPDALAGILAHEVAHIRRRHVTEALIRELGIGAVIRMFAGNVGANAEQLLALSYTRDNEAEADADAIAMLKRAGISPKPTAELFTSLSRDEGDAGSSYGTEFLQSHPLSGKRAQRFAASFNPRTHYRPALSADEWAALSNICGSEQN